MKGKYGSNNWKVRFVYIIQLAVIIVVVAAAGIAIYKYVANRSKKNEDVVEATTTPETEQEEIPTVISTETPSPTATPGPTATPTPESYTGNVEDSVTVIREKYNAVVANRDAGVYWEAFYKDGVTSYLDDNGQLVCAVAELGVDTPAYRTFYYYEGGELFFVYYEGADSHRLYFENGQLIRWRYCPDAAVPENAENHDLEDSEAYRRWEATVIQNLDAMVKLTRCST